jgi:hypothetical protein
MVYKFGQRPCPCGSGLPSQWAYDARRIPLCRTCAKCHTRKMDGYREDVRKDPNYWADEQIEED